MKKAAIWVVLFAALLPLDVAPNLMTSYIDGKAILIRGIAFFSILFITLAVFAEKRVDVRTEVLNRISQVCRDPLFIALTINMLLLVVSTITAFDRVVAFFGEPSRAEGFLTIISFFAFAFSTAVLFGKKQWNTFFTLTAITTSVLFLIEFRQAVLGMDRPDSLTGNPIFLAGYLIFGLASALYLYFRGKKEKEASFRFWGATIAIASIVGIILTKTRGTILALYVGLAVVLIVMVVHGKKVQLGKKTLKFWAGAALGFIVVFSGVFLGTKSAAFWQHVPVLKRIADTSINQGSAASRLAFTRISYNGFVSDGGAKTMLFGWGWDNYLFFFQKHYDPIIYQYDSSLADRAHNKLFDVLIMSGILGLISYLAFWLFLFIYSFKLIRKDLQLGLLMLFFLTAYFVNNLFVFDTQVTYLALFAVTGYLIYSRLEKA